VAARRNRSLSAALLFLCASGIFAACSSAPPSPAAPTAPSGPWGVSCLATQGESGNPACKSAAAFECYGTGTTDANAFCTLFGCTKDSECPAAWWCADVNEIPNVTTDTGTLATIGVTRHVCLPRGQCDPCQTDHDCASTLESGQTEQHCASDSQGSLFCAAQCISSSDCALDAVCKPQWTLCSPASGKACIGDEDCPPADGTYQHCDGGKCTPECGSAANCSAGQTCQPIGLCTPRAGVCVGDGAFCSPCRSDDDCPMGYCFTAAYSTERFCTVFDTATTCDDQEVSPPGCPTPPAGANWKGTMCVITQPSQAECYGVVVIGTSSGSPQDAPGCWTENR
jgi:hypothetical protein